MFYCFNIKIMKTIRYCISKQVLQQLIISNFLFGLVSNINVRSFNKNDNIKFITKKSTAVLKPFITLGYTLKFPLYAFFLNIKKENVISFLNKSLYRKNIVLVKVKNQFFFDTSFISCFLSTHNCFATFVSNLEYSSDLKVKFITCYA